MLQYVLRPIGWLALAVFVLLLPFSLAFREVSRIVFDAEATKEMVRQNLLGGQLASSMASQMAQQLLTAQNGGETLTNAFVQNTLSELNEEDWRTITALTMPQNLVDDTVGEIVTGYTAWLDGDAELPQIRVDLEGWKANIQENASPVLAVVLDSLPECSGAQVANLVLGALQSFDSLFEQISGCRPPEPLYSTVLDNADTLFEASLRLAPSSIDVGELRLLSAAPQQLAEFKESLLRLRQALQWGWLAVVGVGLLGILLTARSLPQALRSLGWSFLLGGAVTFIFGLGLQFFSLNFVDAALSGLLLNQSGAAASLGSAIAGGALDFVSGPLMLQGLIISVLAGCALYAAYVLLQREHSPGIPLNRRRIGW